MGYMIYFALLIGVFLSYDTISARELLKIGQNGKIVSGMEVPIELFPYMAYLLLYDGSDYFLCGGSIISSQYILTAAHCLEEIVNVTVRIGSANANSGGMTYGTTWLYEHHSYDPDNYDYDVALIRVPDMDLDGANATSVPLIRGGSVIPPYTIMNITGWGATSEDSLETEMLMGTSVATLSNPDCQELYGEDAVTDRIFCAGSTESDNGHCLGDSGGPAVSRGRQIGIISSGYGCTTPAFYTNITNLEIRRWIRLHSGV